MRFSYISRLTAPLLLLSSTRAGAVDASSFSASSTVPVPALESAVTKLSTIPTLASYPVSSGRNPTISTIYSDWGSFKKGAAFVWVADMDVDCDGLEYGCEGNPDGQPLTNWGALAAYDVPFIVIPDKFLAANQASLPGNNVAAVICNNKMYYSILGDSNYDDPQVTGEASWLLARSCFPNDNLNGNRGHTVADVTYILFMGEDAVLPGTAINESYITDFNKLKSMGDELVMALASNLGISSNGSTGGGSTSGGADNTGGSGDQNGGESQDGSHGESDDDGSRSHSGSSVGIVASCPSFTGLVLLCWVVVIISGGM